MRKWQKARLRKLAGDPKFRSTVSQLRSEFGLEPGDRRVLEERLTRAGLDVPNLRRKGWLTGVAYEPKSSPRRSWVDAVFEADQKLWQSLGRPLPYAFGDYSHVLTAAVWTEYDGSEFELFCEMTVPIAVKAWSSSTGLGPEVVGDQPRFDEWRDVAFSPGRVYIDVTFADLEDVQRFWGIVSARKKELGLPVPRRGLPSGSKRKVRVLGNLTWAQVRKKVAADPQSVSRLEHRYVEAQIAKKGNTPDVRRAAKGNYRKNVRARLDLRARLGRPPAKKNSF